MSRQTADLRIANLRPLVAPAILVEEELPITETASDTVTRARQEAAAIVAGQDDRLLVIVGPCSVHDTQAAIEYAGLLSRCADHLSDDLCVIMRVYFEKPRTVVGWKGPINDPHLDGSFAINQGLRKARRLLLDLGDMGVPAGSEFLDTISPQFTADLISWGAIGARTTESQVHRELASGLSMPVGFKNGTDGNIQIAIDAIRAAQHPHRFLSVTKHGVAAIFETTGNDCCHLILRGSDTGTNFDSESVGSAVATLDAAGLAARLMVDCSHGNSRKNHANQPAVAQSLAEQVGSGSSGVFGVMMESHLHEGNQALGDDAQSLTYGQSITDACVSWDMTEPMLEKLAWASRRRRQRK